MTHLPLANDDNHKRPPAAAGEAPAAGAVPAMAAARALMGEAPGKPRRPGLFARLDAQAPSVERLSDSRGPLLAGTLVILLTFVGLGAWAATAPLDSAAIAPGVVTVQNNRRLVQHLEGGIVAELMVGEGQTVAEGDVLLRLDQTRVRAQWQILRADLDQLLGTEARLIAERDSLPKPVFPEELLDRNAEGEVQQVIATQHRIFDTRKQSIDGQRDILNQRVSQLHEQIEGLRALEASKRDQFDLIQDELVGMRQLLNKKLVARNRVLALEREAARLEGERGDHVSSIARAEQSIGEAHMQILQLDKGRQEEIARELRDNQTQIGETRERLVAASDVMQRIDVTAPVSGQVLNLAVHTVGGVVGPGQTIMEIVPSDDRLIAEVQISPGDIDSVHAGMEVSLRFGLVDARLSPTITGTLENISADRITDQQSHQVFYKGRVEIPEDEARKLGNLRLLSGMPVEAMIKRGERTALSYIVKPLTDRLHGAFREN